MDRRAFNNSTVNLYIPHGSDESLNEYWQLMSIFLFISHMVQMKVDTLEGFAYTVSHFISHMVQMKDDIVDRNIPEQLLFISHMVQMKDNY